MINKMEMEQFIEDYFKGEIFSKIEIERTPLGIRIIIHTSRPGRIIGAGGRKINELAERFKEKFKIENPQIDVKSIKNPDMDAMIVARQIALAIESGNNFKKIGNLFVKRVMDAGALGVEIMISGKIGGSKGRREKFSAGYLKHCGDTSKRLVDRGYAEALVKLGKIGIQVKIMKYLMDTFGNILSKKDIMERGIVIQKEKIEEEDEEVVEEILEGEEETAEDEAAEEKDAASEESKEKEKNENK